MSCSMPEYQSHVVIECAYHSRQKTFVYSASPPFHYNYPDVHGNSYTVGFPAYSACSSYVGYSDNPATTPGLAYSGTMLHAGH
jgi:hypothetical protein